MAGFGSFPFEIHSMILEYCDFKTVQSYSLVANATTSSAERHLYRELHLGPAGHVTQWTCKTIQCLLRTLAERPDLSVLVKSVHLDLDYTCNFEEETRYLEKVSVERADSHLTSLARTVVEDLGLPNSRWWDIKLRHTSLDPWIAVKVAGLNYGPEIYMPFLNLPSLQVFVMSLGHIPKIKQCAVLPKLENLHLGWNGVSGVHGIVDFEAVKAALDPISQQLKSLTLGVTHYRPKSRHLAAEDDPSRPFIEWADSALGSLVSLISLEHLEVSVNMLLNFVPWIDTLEDILPKSLKSLVLTDETLTWHQGIFAYLLQPWEHSLHEVVGLLGRYLLLHERFTPHLTSVALDFRAAVGSDGSVPLELERSLRSVAEASHVTVKILYVQAYPLEHFTRLYPIALTIYNRETPKVAPMI
ncbi:hypothetical protein BJY00DRAFT_314711 [Aspergillus carlsbadensis]|nr:hypothetical protein BJY00DRAFT_314711 [Aspergillus carlsbadensis]